MKVSNITSTTFWNGHQVTYTWIASNNLNNHQPITQVYGVCLNQKHDVLICREPGRVSWGLPGGTPEGKETPLQTLERELMEEVDIIVDTVELLGVQKVEFPKNPDKSEGKIFYQARYLCQIKELLPQTPDPDTGLIYERQSIPLSELNQHLNWGPVGDAIVKQAIEVSQHPHLQKIQEILLFVTKKLNHLKIKWILGASGALMVHGIDIVPWDIDILTIPNNLEIIAKEFKDFIVSSDEDGFQLKINDIEVEIIKLKDLGSPKPIMFQGVFVPVNSLKNELLYYQKRPDKEVIIKLIKQKLSQ